MSLFSATMVAAVGVIAPLLITLLKLQIPAIPVQIVLGIVIGPQVLGWASVDAPVSVLALIGLGFLLFLAGLEIDFEQLRGTVLAIASGAFAASILLAAAVALALSSLDLTRSPSLLAIILTATSLGIVVPVIEDAGQLTTPLGRLVMAGGSLAEVLPIVLLSVLFSKESPGIGSQITLLARGNAETRRSRHYGHPPAPTPQAARGRIRSFHPLLLRLDWHEAGRPWTPCEWISFRARPDLPRRNRVRPCGAGVALSAAPEATRPMACGRAASGDLDQHPHCRRSVGSRPGASARRELRGVGRRWPCIGADLSADCDPHHEPGPGANGHDHCAQEQRTARLMTSALKLASV